MDSLDQIRYVTKYLAFLQGLKLLPMAVALLVCSVGIMALGDGTLTLVKVATLLALVEVVSLGGYALAALYYRRVFGHARPTHSMQRRTVWAMLGTAVAFFGVGFGLLLLPVGPAWRAAFGLGALGLFSLWYWRWSEKRLSHYLYAAGALFAVGLLEGFAGPVSGWALTASPVRAAVADAFLAMALFIGTVALLDHRLLMRTLHPADSGPEAA